MQDKVEAPGDHDDSGFVDADNLTGLLGSVCASCHSLQGGPSAGFETLASCDNVTWKSHNIDGRLAGKVWEYVSAKQHGATCGW